ncbi:hypothetical protein B0T20DRAFT_78113 [Sordaria brevicollis]|uniref:Uncharacterized protein n=1 Tax=Sordaria brevicollis TaxID=83679 RepID=A0AAE0U574_SORBR|nr:hypothetical protein B0T20DRAFT_78113 [Sordaria brevicollis]
MSLSAASHILRAHPPIKNWHKRVGTCSAAHVAGSSTSFLHRRLSFINDQLFLPPTSASRPLAVEALHYHNTTQDVTTCIFAFLAASCRVKYGPAIFPVVCTRIAPKGFSLNPESDFLDTTKFETMTQTRQFSQRSISALSMTHTKARPCFLHENAGVPLPSSVRVLWRNTRLPIGRLKIRKGCRGLASSIQLGRVALARNATCRIPILAKTFQNHTLLKRIPRDRTFHLASLLIEGLGTLSQLSIVWKLSSVNTWTQDFSASPLPAPETVNRLQPFFVHAVRPSLFFVPGHFLWPHDRV